MRWMRPVAKANVFQLLLANCIVNSKLNSLLLILHIVVLVSVTDISAGNVKPKTEIYIPNYDIYHNLSHIQKHLESIAAVHPNFIQLDPVYKSRHNRPQMLVRVTNYSDSTRGILESDTASIPKVKVLLSYGEHAREFFPIESMFHLLNNLTSGVTAPKGSPEFEFSFRILSQIDLFIVAVVNPDGRHHVETTGNYCWRGTSTGVDLNRNFDWNFGQKGSSANVNDEEYRGTKPFSEPETTVLLDLTQKYRFDAFVSLHSGIKQIYVPFADTISKKKHHKPPNLSSMLDAADRMSHATNAQFTYGVAYQLNEYTADGTIFDFMAGIRKIPFSFAIELWGEGDHKGAKCFDLFNPRSEMLNSAVEDIHPLYEELFFYLIKWKHKTVRENYDPFAGAPSLIFGYLLLCVVIFMTLLVAINHRFPLCVRLFPRRRIISLRSLSSTFSIMAFRF